MSFQEFQELRQQLQEEQRLRKDAELQLKLQTQNTTLAEFLDACHVHLFLRVFVQKDKDSSTKGDPANADRKLRPDYIREWKDFPKEQLALWQDLMDAEFVAERNFTPLLVLKEYGKELRERSLGSELDLGYFERQTVESRVASVIKQLHANTRLRQAFRLKGDVAFENHANTLTDESKLAADMSSMSLGQSRRSERLAAKSGQGVSPSSSLAPARSRKVPQKHSRPRADQFCVYNKDSEDNVPAFIIEYKAPHKLSLAHIRAGLHDMDLDQILHLRENETPEDTCRRIMGAVITQATSYMNYAGLEFGYICTGEAFIFLRVLHNDPRTAYYFLSVPREDVGETTGWTGDLNGENRLHLTALGQVLAFTLRALRTSPRDIGWIKWAESKLKTWEMVYDDILDEIGEKDVPSSDFKPSARSRDAYCRMSPVKTRSKSGLPSGESCNPSENRLSSDNDDDSGDGFDPTTPSRKPQDRNTASRLVRHDTVHPSKNPGFKDTARQYCTQQCLRGLLMGYGLDKSCPNASDHGVGRHQLNVTTLIHRLRQQLSFNNLHAYSQVGCASLHIHGTRGAVFKLTLDSHGYTFLGKGVPAEFIRHSKREESIYSHLTPIQGVIVPVVLGGLDLPSPFSYDGIAQVVHLTLMSYTGKSLSRLHEADRNDMVQQAESSLRAIHKLGVLHGDPIAGNMIWNEENRRVMFIDFERATFKIQGEPLAPISSNQKRKRMISTIDKSQRKRRNCFDYETRRMKNGL